MTQICDFSTDKYQHLTETYQQIIYNPHLSNHESLDHHQFSQIHHTCTFVNTAQYRTACNLSEEDAQSRIFTISLARAL